MVSVERGGRAGAGAPPVVWIACGTIHPNSRFTRAGHWHPGSETGCPALWGARRLAEVLGPIDEGRSLTLSRKSATRGGSIQNDIDFRPRPRGLSSIRGSPGSPPIYLDFVIVERRRPFGRMAGCARRQGFLLFGVRGSFATLGFSADRLRRTEILEDGRRAQRWSRGRNVGYRSG